MHTTDLEESILKTMQSAFEADPAAMRALVVNRVPCNDALADHPSIVVSDVPLVEPTRRWEVGLIGVLVGLMCDAGCKRLISWKFDDNVENKAKPIFVGFQLTDRT